MAESMGEHLRRNTRATMATWFLGQGLNFIRMLLLIRFLRTEDYGLWIFSFSIISYFTIYSFGISQAFVKYTADFRARGDNQGLSHLLSTGLVAGMILGAVVAVLVTLFTDTMIRFFDLPQEMVGQARFVIIGVGLTSAVNMAFGGFESILIGLHRIDLKNYSRVGTLTVEFAITVLALLLGYGLEAVVSLYAIGTLAAIALFAWHVKRLAPELRINPLNARWRCVPDIAVLGGRMQILGIVAMLVSTADIIVFMKFGSPVFVGLYGAAQRFAQRAQGLALQGFGALAPASADLFARGAREEVARVYLGAQRFTTVGCAWLFSFILVFHDVIMIFVMNDKYAPLASYALATLSIGYFVHTLTGPGSSMLRGAGLPEREMLYQVLTVVFFLALFFPAYRAGNEFGMVASWPISLAAASLCFIWLGNRYFRVAWWSPFRETWPVLVAALGIAAVLRLGLYPLPPITSQGPAFAAVVVFGTLYSLCFFAAAWWLPGLTPDDKTQILKFLPLGDRLRSAIARRGA